MFRLLLLWAFTVFWDVSGIFADPVDVVVAKNKDFARIVFSWERPVAYDFRSNGRDVYIKFKRNIDASFQPILDKIPGYIEDVEVGKDGLGIKLKMRSDFDAYSYDSGSSVIIEIEGIPKKINSTTTLTKKKGNGSDNTQGNISEPDKVLGTVRSRFAEHSEYTRIVFDWVKPVPYKFEEKSGVVTVLFERSANVDISKLVKSPPRFIGEIKTRSNLNSSIVVLSVPPTSEVKHFVSGTKVVIDVGQPKNEAKIQKLPQGIFKEIDTLKTNKKKSSQILVFKQKRETLKTKQEASKIVKSVSKEKNSVISEKKETKGEVNASSSTLTLEKEKKGVVEKSSSNKIGKPASLSKRPKNESDLDADGKVKLASISMQKVEGANGGLAVKFNWKEPVAAAVFRRTGALWIAFDKKRRVDTNKLLGVLPVPEGVEAPPPPPDPENLPPPKPSLKDLVKSIEQITATGGTVLRLITNKGINPTLSRDGNSWILTFSRRQLKPNNPIEVRAEPNFPDGPRIFMPLAKSGSPLGVTDIETGYNMVIVPVIPLSHGVARGFVYPEVEVLETGQGAALIPSIDNLRVQSITKGIVLKSSVPINLSNVSGELLAATKKSIPGQLVTELELEQWSTLDGLDFQKRKEELQKFVAKAKNTKDIIEKNFDLARFYFSNGYGAEAIGVLKVIGSKQPEAIKNAEGLLLLAGSNYLMGRFSDSAIYLRNSKLDKIDEAAFWRAATVSKSGKMVAGAYEMQRTGDVIKTYPKPLQIPLSIFIAEAAVAIGQDKRAKDMIKSINKMELILSKRLKLVLLREILQ